MLNIKTRSEVEDDCRVYYAEVSGDNQTGFGTAYDENKAISKAIANLKLKETAAPANWENTPESWLASVRIGEVCPDYSPDMFQLAIE